jgi:site-specific DNA-adenine methylase
MKSYFGGKNGNGTFQNIINIIPPHSLYIEPFGGSGAIIRKKKPSLCDILTDISQSVITDYHSSSLYHSGVMDAFDLLQNISYVDLTDCFIYLDPPYLHSTRKQTATLYDFELTCTKHLRLLTSLNHLCCSIAISCYDCELYSSLLSTWSKIQFNSMTRSGAVIETVYFNYPPPSFLHDYSFIGSDYTDRQRIKRLISRNSSRLLKLPPLVLNALLEELS